jgi:HEAT repeat protein
VSAPPPPPPAHTLPSRRPAQRKSPAGLFIILMLSAILIGTVIWGFFVYSDKQEEQRQADTYNRLVKEDAPKGDGAAVIVMADMMARGGKIEKNAVTVLKKLEGPGVEHMIVQQINETTAGPRVNLIGVAVERKLPKTVPALIRAAGSSSETAVREAGLIGLIELAGADQLDAVLGLIKNIPDSQESERRLLIEAVYAAASRETGSRGSVRLISALSGMSKVADRSVLVKVLGRLGGDEALSILEEELNHTDEEAQRAAVVGLARWPNGKAAQILSDYSQNTSNTSLKEMAMKGFVQVIGRSGDLPGEKKVEHLMKAIQSVQSSTTKRALFLELSKIPDEAALDFLADLYDNAEDRKTESYAEQAERQLAELLPRVIDVDDVEVLLDAEKATLTATRGLFFNRIENTIQNWDQPSAWVLWHVRIKEPGQYLVEVIQAHVDDPNNTYEVHFGGSALPCNVVPTASREEFENVEAGTIEIKGPGLYELIVKPVKIKGGSLMILRGIALVKDD